MAAVAYVIERPDRRRQWFGRRRRKNRKTKLDGLALDREGCARFRLAA